MNRTKKLLILGVLPAVVVAVIFTALVKFIDVRPIGPEGSAVGFSGINSAIHPTEDINKMWYIITDWAWPVLIAIAGFYAVLGLVQLIKRKSLFKVDKELLILAGLYLAMLVVYVVFEKLLIINYRPVLLGHGLEPSYPSSHTLFTVCICGSAMMINQILFKKKYPRAVCAANIILFIVGLLIIVGRLLSGVHWFTDIVGGILIGNVLLVVMWAFLEKYAIIESGKL